MFIIHSRVNCRGETLKSPSIKPARWENGKMWKVSRSSRLSRVFLLRWLMAVWFTADACKWNEPSRPCFVSMEIELTSRANDDGMFSIRTSKIEFTAFDSGHVAVIAQPPFSSLLLQYFLRPFAVSFSFAEGRWSFLWRSAVRYSTHEAASLLVSCRVPSLMFINFSWQ